MPKTDANDISATYGPEALIQSAGEAEARAIVEKVGCEPLSLAYLNQLDTHLDADCLLGRRWLCRGGCALWIGETGHGKSALAMQAAIRFGLGEDLFGLRPVRALKSVLVQAENDHGDLAEAVQGVFRGLNLSNLERDCADEMVKIYCRDDITGSGFVDWLDAILKRHAGTDLVWIDPIFSFFGGDLSDSEASAKFFRHTLGPCIKRNRCAGMLIHHPPKPPRDSKGRPTSPADLAYFGFGSSDLPNWSRASMALTTTKTEGLYQLTAAKRRNRAGLKHPQNPATTEVEYSHTVYLQHGANGQIFWEQVRPPEAGETALPELTDEMLITVLSPEWMRRKLIVPAIALRFSVTQKDADAMLEKVKARHRLDELKREDGVRDCGLFLTDIEYGGIRFKLKANSQNPENPL